MECPIVKRTEYQLIDIDDEGFCSLMDDTGETRDDLKPLEPELEKQIREYQKIIEEQEARSSELARQERQMLLQIEEANERAENAENQMAKLRKRNKI